MTTNAHRTKFRYSKLSGDQCMYYSAPSMQGMMCGVHYARQFQDGTIELTYSDGSKEAAPVPEKDIGEFESLFQIVSLVQDRARNGVVS